MEIEINLSKLQKCKLFLAAPMYGGQCTGIFANSMISLAQVMMQHGVELRCHFLFNESLITRARNYCVDEFLRSDCTHFMFIDADIGFHPEDVLVLLALITQDDNEYDILCGPYPKKTISWEKVKTAADRGFADENPNNLEKYVGDFVFNLADDVTEVRLDTPAQVLEGGTGFMMIKRSTFEKYEEAYPELHYKPDHVRSEHFDGSREIMAYFDTEIDPKSKRYLSEDYMFTQRAIRAGMKIWLCPWMKLKHMGAYVFSGSLSDLAQVGVNPTASFDELENTKARNKKKNKLSIDK